MSDAIATNRKAFRDYFFTEHWECGIMLEGCEVKSIRAGKVDFKDSYARIEKGELFLYNLHIDVYDQAGYVKPDPDRPRKLLVHKRELKKLIGYIAQKNLLLVPTRIYLNARGFVKVAVALGKGKKLYDKRENIKKRTMDRHISRVIRSKQKGR
ncbi:MAG TPA: SsrA-binding protein SmpB [Candidatus Omnitrophota bacterium]|nr:SsrA-binding protein SmpB [Candidatus Omnitrophota bacterium]